MKFKKQHIALVYVTLILLFKVTGLHALQHQTDDIDVHHCEICEISTVVNFTPTLGGSQVELPQAPHFLSEQKLVDTNSTIVFENKFLSSFLHTRPPPSIS